MRYLILLLLNLPIILLSILDIVTSYKMKKINRGIFLGRITLWVIILAVIIGAIPIYNLITDHKIFDSNELSLFDIVEITVIIALIFYTNSLRVQIDKNELRLQNLHEELSITISDRDNK